MGNLRQKIIGALFFCLVAVCSSSAQSRQMKWEIEVHGSGFLKDDANGGAKSLPGPGPSFATVVANTHSSGRALRFCTFFFCMETRRPSKVQEF